MKNTAENFDLFWQAFPRKVGKIAAQKAFQKAIKGGATIDALLDGIARYVQHKPQYADYCHPVTWLNQGRWLDEYEPKATKPTNLGAGVTGPISAEKRSAYDALSMRAEEPR